MNRNLVLLLIVTLVCAAVFGTTWWYFNHDVLQVINIPMDVKVEDHMAFNVDGDALHFGKVAPGTSSDRGFVLNSTFDVLVLAELRFSGQMAPWMSVTQGFIYLAPHGTQQVNITVTAPDDATRGIYNGTMTAIFRRAR